MCPILLINLSLTVSLSWTVLSILYDPFLTFILCLHPLISPHTYSFSFPSLVYPFTTCTLPSIHSFLNISIHPSSSYLLTFLSTAPRHPSSFLPSSPHSLDPISLTHSLTISPVYSSFIFMIGKMIQKNIFSREKSEEINFLISVKVIIQISSQS